MPEPYVAGKLDSAYTNFILDIVTNVSAGLEASAA